MKKFAFNLEALLTIRSWDERNARQALGVATSEMMRLRDEQEALAQERDAAYAGWNDQERPVVRPRERINFGSQLAQIDLKERNAASDLVTAEQARLKAVRALELAARRKKAVEKLKELRLMEHRAAYYRQEARDIEDIYNARRKD